MKAGTIEQRVDLGPAGAAPAGACTRSKGRPPFAGSPGLPRKWRAGEIVEGDVRGDVDRIRAQQIGKERHLHRLPLEIVGDVLAHGRRGCRCGKRSSSDTSRPPRAGGLASRVCETRHAEDGEAFLRGPSEGGGASWIRGMGCVCPANGVRVAHSAAGGAVQKPCKDFFQLFCKRLSQGLARPWGQTLARVWRSLPRGQRGDPDVARNEASRVELHGNVFAAPPNSRPVVVVAQERIARLGRERSRKPNCRDRRNRRHPGSPRHWC